MKKMKKMKKQFLSLFVLLCMIISMFPTTALAANIIDVSGNVTITRSDEELTCADNLYYGEVNVNGSATESKTRLTHPVLPLIQWQYGNNTYQIIPSAYKYYVYNINDPNHILEGIEGSEGSSTLSGWPGTYKCYQTVVTTDGVTNGTATFDIDLIYQFSRLNSSIGWTYASNWGGRTLHFTIKQTVAYTVTYTDGVEDEEVFADEVHENLSSGVATPAFSGGTPTRTADLRGGTGMRDTNEMEIQFDSKSCNEGFARVAVASFLTQMNPTVEEVADVKTAVSEAVTNAIIHGYEKRQGKIRIFCRISKNQFFMEVSDKGKGILNVEEAMQPMYTTKPEEDRSGMGFAFMEAFMDAVKVESEPEKGTCVRMKKIIGKGRELWTTQSL